MNPVIAGLQIHRIALKALHTTCLQSSRVFIHAFLGRRHSGVGRRGNRHHAQACRREIGTRRRGAFGSVFGVLNRAHFRLDFDREIHGIGDEAFCMGRVMQFPCPGKI